MKRNTILAFFFILVFTLGAYSQTGKKKNYFPAWTFQQDSITIHGLSVGLWSANAGPRYTNTNGVKLELIGLGIIVPLVPRSPLPENDSAFAALKAAPVSERINGLVLSGLGTTCHCVVNGVQAGLIGHYTYTVNGISVAGMVTFIQRHNGILLSNFSEVYHMNGIQVGFVNRGYKARGLQIGLVQNLSKDVKGLQIGLINKPEKFKGIQIGFWNVNQKRKLPLLNWNFS